MCTPPDARLFATPSGARATEIKAPRKRMISAPPSITAVPVPTTHLPRRRTPPTTLTNSVVVTSPPSTKDQSAITDRKDIEDVSADTQVRRAAVKPNYGLYNFKTSVQNVPQEWISTLLTFRHRAPCILGRAFHYSPKNAFYTGCNRNGPDFGRLFLRSYCTDITQNTYIQSSMVTEILAREV